ncbi:DUF3616 domain-containing protein [Lusitaniella coriacea LEGE 07157]|uniref:DUF3616 domain-containing protein n=1 Tax=Lusitaniella coriacea LEGE 07157 TaxID=945747 RepID=A0A8J7DYS4_9CYAN|nr:DUF3616 domain-containing protein [Lusitaniella coriacea]MBE9117721.1 DUF3616 domain-containing protein [Lusitaniella coriacea LEGE 07157]
MSESFLLARALLQFDKKADDLLGDISAVARTPDGSLWVASDERLGIERLSSIEPLLFGNHQHYHIGDFIELFDDEIDIEGMDYSEGYLWLVGSHSTKRKKPKGKKEEKDLERLLEVKHERNRYLLARIPVVNGKLLKSYASSDRAEDRLTAACLEKTETENILMEALAKDPHFGKIIASDLPSKENGFDIEGLVVRGNRIFLGLRGPVLRGWAIILELKVEETQPGILTLAAIGEDELPYKKHFLELDGLGVRELCWHGDNLLILAGPTMVLEGAMKIFELQEILECSGNSLCWQESGRLKALFNLPVATGADRAEGLTLFPHLGKSEGLMVVYDSPHPNRMPNSHKVYADLFRLP